MNKPLLTFAVNNVWVVLDDKGGGDEIDSIWSTSKEAHEHSKSIAGSSVVRMPLNDPTDPGELEVNTEICKKTFRSK